MVSRIFNRGSDLERYRLSILHSRGNGNKKVGEKSEVDEVNRVPSNTSSLTTTKFTSTPKNFEAKITLHTDHTINRESIFTFSSSVSFFYQA